MTRKLIVVLGMHRSGTSALTGLMSLLGAFPGSDLLPANSSNQKGYFESRKVVDLNNRILASLGSRWDSVQPLPDGCWNNSELQPYKDEIARLLQSEFEVGLPVIKDPRMCIVLPIWLAVFREMGISPCFVVTVRNPQSVAISQRKMKGIPLLKSLVLYGNYYLAAEEYSDGYPRVFVRFAEVINTPLETLLSIERALEINFSVKPLDRAVIAKEFLDSKLAHGEAIDANAWDCGHVLNLCHELETLLNGIEKGLLITFREKYFSYMRSVKTWLDVMDYAVTLEHKLPCDNEVRLSLPKYRSSLTWTEANSHVFSEFDRSDFAFNDAGEKILIFPINKAVSRDTVFRLTLFNFPVQAYFSLIEVICNDKKPVSKPFDDVAITSKSEFAVLVDGATVHEKSIWILPNPGEYLEFKLPELPNITAVDGCVLTIAVTLESIVNSAQLLAIQCNDNTNQIVELSAKLATLIETHGTLGVALASKNEDLETAISNLRMCREEIIRAEMQLDLLKEFSFGKLQDLDSL
ncbi:MAG: hypothetical protein CFE39_05435 [Comamonadaceae bacterium PBBC2]|nr:MAG: hypothetical protein CFE39_05435 [Comamonadaceae bacterium PBBC2]